MLGCRRPSCDGAGWVPAGRRSGRGSGLVAGLLPATVQNLPTRLVSGWICDSRGSGECGWRASSGLLREGRNTRATTGKRPCFRWAAGDRAARSLWAEYYRGEATEVFKAET